MSGIALAISDVDGTLVRTDKSLSKGVVAAVGRCRAAGIGFSLISARPPSGLLWIADKLRLTDPIGAFNGGTILHPDGRILSADRLDRHTAAETLRLLDQRGIDPWLFRDGLWHVRTLDNVHVDKERKAANIEPTVSGDLDALLDRVDKIVGVSEDHDLLAGIEHDVAEALGKRATVARSQPYYLDVTSPRGNKGAGVIALAEAIGVPLDRIAVMGDQYNDLAMFAKAGISIAMGQAPQPVKDAATHVVVENDADGVADAIDTIIIRQD